MKRAFTAIFLVLLVGSAPGTLRAQLAPGSDFSVNVDLVVLNATVHDGKGRPATALREQDFEVYEDGVRQSIRLFRHEDIPVTVGLVVDHSGSMRNKIADVTAAARAFVRSSSAQDEMFVVNFNEKVTVGLPDGMAFTNRAEELERAILKAPVTGQTALYDAIARALDMVKDGTREKKVLIVVSDGGDNKSTTGLATILKTEEQSTALVYTIGIFDESNEDRNPDVLRRLARATGGDAFFPREFSEIAGICEIIAREIRSQYSIGYVSSNAAKPGYHAVRVVARTAENPKLTVRTRAGYSAVAK